MRVIETFGPTIQGEGPYAGRVCHFLRVGGCDFRCSWCDTPQAVDPALVRQADNLTLTEVIDRLAALPPAPMLVISGGNPVLWDLQGLMRDVTVRYQRVAVETQGTRWRAWLNNVDSLVVSPKPPSSGMATPAHDLAFARFMAQAGRHPGLALKVVVFDDTDLTWATDVHAAYPDLPFYLSAGTDQDQTEYVDTVIGVADRYSWLCEQVAARPALHAASVLPQLHVIAWGHRVGV